ncbi:MAG: hypothetical protein HYU64_00090 [Armatimonadetes bacterium]|nr:hypothetical protein [Armatimonadota bacterium]
MIIYIDASALVKRYHLASALFWQDVLGEHVTVATYDRQLWESARAVDLTTWPKSRP